LAGSEADAGRRAGAVRLAEAPLVLALRAAQRWRAGSTASSAFQVVVPIAPSATIPREVWKERTAVAVFLP
jgi:hypothetical protein